MTNSAEWAERELEIAGYRADDTEGGPNKWIRENVLELLRTFAAQGHSGMSAPHAIQMFTRLASRKPLAPLTGDDSEWKGRGNDQLQNKRYSEVFRNTKTGDDFWIRGVVFWEWAEEENGEKFKSYFTTRDSCVSITFPFTVPDEPEYREAKETDQ